MIKRHFLNRVLCIPELLQVSDRCWPAAGLWVSLYIHIHTYDSGPPMSGGNKR
jgi:hypothetical protein